MLNILENELLSKYTTFRVGGPAKYFVIVKNIDELKEALAWAEKNKEKYFILGGGSNVLFGDRGFSGLVIKIVFIDIEFQDDVMIVGSGVPLMLAVKKSASEGFAGLENFAGIPGSVGGAVCGNAGAYGKSMSDILLRIELLIDNKVEVVDTSWFEFGYRYSKLKYWNKENKPIILRAFFKLTKGDKEDLEKKVRDKIEQRKAKEPKGFCAGCAFKNIKGEVVVKLLKTINCTPEERERFSKFGAIPAAWFIERAELKGKKIGGAYVPKEHANYVMNDGTATTEDIITMLSFIKQQVRDKFNIQLEEEVQIVV